MDGSSHFQPGEGPSRGLLRDCTTGCGTDGSFYSTKKELIIAVFVLTSLLSVLCSLCSYNLILLPWDRDKCVNFLTAGSVINFTTVLFVCLYVLLVRHDI